MKNELSRLTIHEAHRMLKERRISSVELTQAVLDRIQKVEPQIKAFVTVTGETALQQAAEADKRIGRGEIAPLTGFPALLKT